VKKVFRRAVWNRTPNCRRCRCHYAAPAKTLFRAVSADFASRKAAAVPFPPRCAFVDAFHSARSTVAIKSLINVPVYIAHLPTRIPTQNLASEPEALFSSFADLCPSASSEPE
jgi:hypothetical protein